MTSIITAVVSVSVIGLICAVALTIASKLMSVPVDERYANVRARLPGANCGACGYSGCDGYAEALVNDDAAINLCSPGGSDTINQLAEVLDKESGGGIVRRAAFVHCLGDLDTVREKLEYTGIRTCAAAKELFGGQGACTFGCVGYGDCAVVCPAGAICVENGLARVDRRRCTGCGLCVKACPNKIITVEDASVSVVVMCKNTEKGAQLKDKCSKGCIGCMKCVKECPSEAIAVTDFLAGISYDKCTGCAKCAPVCVKGSIKVIERNQPA